MISRLEKKFHLTLCSVHAPSLHEGNSLSVVFRKGGCLETSVL